MKIAIDQQTSATNINSLKPTDNKNQSKSSSVLPSTPVRTSSHSVNHIKGRVIANHRPLPSRSNNNNRSNDLNGSRTTNTSANVSPSLNDNNSRTVLLGSDDIRTPSHHHSRHRQRSTQVHTDSTADYDDVASHSTVDDTTPQTSSENASISEVPSESRFKTFVRQKKNKGLANPAEVITAAAKVPLDRYDKCLPPAPGSENTDNEPSTNLLSEHYADALPIRANGSSQRGTHFAGKEVDPNQRLSSEINSAGRQNGTSDCDGHDGDNDDDDEDDDDDHDQDGDDKRNANRRGQDQNDDDSDESADEDEYDAEEGVYDLGTSNLFLD